MGGGGNLGEGPRFKGDLSGRGNSQKSSEKEGERPVVLKEKRRQNSKTRKLVRPCFFG